ncbi:hypothetical protein ACFL0I_03785, partial [Gemmatimonadota bacterium]
MPDHDASPEMMGAPMRLAEAAAGLRRNGESWVMYRVERLSASDLLAAGFHHVRTDEDVESVEPVTPESL